MTLAEMRSRTLERLDEDSQNPVTWTAAEATAALNQGLALMVLLTFCLEKTANVTVSGVSAFFDAISQVPDYLAPLRLRFAGSKVRSARLADLDALDPAWMNAQGAAIERYGSAGFSLLFAYPLVAGSAEMVYANAPAPLVADLDTPATPPYTHPALIEYAIYELRQKQGGSEFAGSLANLKAFFDVAMQLNAQVRTRSLAQRYDRLPMELDRADLSRLLSIRKELLPKQESNAR